MAFRKKKKEVLYREESKIGSGEVSRLFLAGQQKVSCIRVE